MMSRFATAEAPRLPVTDITRPLVDPTGGRVALAEPGGRIAPPLPPRRAMAGGAPDDRAFAAPMFNPGGVRRQAVAPIPLPGMAVAPPPVAEPVVPPAAAPVPSAVGGIGGLGGLPWGNMLQAVGMSMMMSDARSPLANFPTIFASLQQQGQQQREQAEGRRAMISALVRLGFSPEEAETYAASPEAIRLVAEHSKAERERADAEAARAAQQQLLGGMTPLDTFTGGGGGAQRDFVPLGEGIPRAPLGAEGAVPPALGFRYSQAPQAEGDPTPLGAQTQRLLGGGEAQGAPRAPTREDPEARLAQLEGMRQERLQLLGSGMLDTAGRARVETELRAIQDWTNHYQASIRDNASERQIRALEARGMSRGEAENIVYGFVRPETDPVRGGTRLVDVVEGTITPLREITTDGPRAAEPSPVPEGQTLFGNAEQATGFGNTIRSGLADTVGQVPLVGRFFDFAETVEARQRFAVSTNELIRALSINPRFPVAEMERLREEINIAPSAMRSTEATRNRMRVIDEALRRRLENERRAADDPNLPAETRRAAAQASNDIANFLAALGVPRGPQPGTVERGDDGSEWRFRGGDPADPTSWERVR